MHIILGKNSTLEEVVPTIESTSSQSRNAESDMGSYSAGTMESKTAPSPILISLPSESLQASTENETTTTIAIVTTTKIGPAEGLQESETKELSQYDDYNYGWKEDSEVLEVFGDEENGIGLYEDKCIYSSPLQLWEEDFDFSIITTAEIQDKVTRALSEE